MERLLGWEKEKEKRGRRMIDKSEEKRSVHWEEPTGRKALLLRKQ